jgi:hypothetical protein
MAQQAAISFLLHDLEVSVVWVMDIGTLLTLFPPGSLGPFR